ncbi:hypothetical protein [Algoriphagus sp.]|uniref:hypothetical protein n=1 Tax=Algoriphagus sp. TaxID=1872435 RepID=UPI00391BF79A
MTISASSVNSKNPKRHFIAIGFDACVLVSYWGKKLNYDTFTQINDREISEREVPVTFFKFDPTDYIYTNYELMRFLIKEDLSIPHLPNEVINHLRGLDGELVIYAGVGDSEGPYSGRIYRTSFIQLG